MLKTLTPFEIAQCVYPLYFSGKYDVFFRHFPRLLAAEEFVSEMLKMGKVIGVCNDQADFQGMAVLNIQPLPRICVFSFLIDEQFQEMKIGLHAMQELVKLIFIDCGCERIVSHVLEEDQRTQELALKFGFEKEAQLKKSCLHRHQLKNEVRLVLEREAFEKGKDYGRCC